MRNETKLTVYADVAISQIINEMGEAELREILNAFNASAIADAILSLPQGRIERIRELIKDEECAKQ